MFHPIDTGPFKSVVLRPTDSIKAHRQSRYSKPGRAYPTASNTQFSAAHRPLSTLLGHSVSRWEWLFLPHSGPTCRVEKMDGQREACIESDARLVHCTARDSLCSLRAKRRWEQPPTAKGERV
jgi:hypothetical protein